MHGLKTLQNQSFWYLVREPESQEPATWEPVAPCPLAPWQFKSPPWLLGVLVWGRRPIRSVPSHPPCVSSSPWLAPPTGSYARWRRLHSLVCSVSVFKSLAQRNGDSIFQVVFVALFFNFFIILFLKCFLGFTSNGRSGFKTTGTWNTRGVFQQ